MKPSRAASLVMVLLAAALLSGLATGCHPKKRAPERTAEELARDGMAAYTRGDYTDSIRDFEMLRDWYPFSKFLILAELKLPDAHFQREEYEEAAAGYDHFEKMHPANEAVPYVIYQLGMCHYKRLRDADRDQTPASEALAAFNRLISEYPASPYAKKAADPIRTCQEHLAEHELTIGRYYLRHGNYAAALKRFENVMTRYPDVGVHHKALDLIAETRSRMGGKAPEPKPAAK